MDKENLAPLHSLRGVGPYPYGPEAAIGMLEYWNHGIMARPGATGLLGVSVIAMSQTQEFYDQETIITVWARGSGKMSH